MKKTIIASLIALGLLCSGAIPTAVQAATVNVKKAEYPITINTKVINQTNKKYPYLVYNKVTYIPMSKEDKALLGLKSSWVAKTKKIFINSPKANFDAFNASEAYKPSQENDKKNHKAVTNPHRLFINGKQVNKTLKNPAINYKNTTYLPVDWENAVNNFGWYYHFDEKNGLVVSTNEVPDSEKKYQLAVYQKEVLVYAKPNKKANVIGIAKAGQLFKFEQAGSGWYKIALEGSQDGYLHGEGIEADLSRFSSKYHKRKQPKAPLPQSTPSANNKNEISKAPTFNEAQVKAISKNVQVSGEVVNLRKGPGTEFQLKGSTKKGDVLQVVGEYGNWYKLSYQGETAWIAAWLTLPEGSVIKNSTLSPNHRPSTDETKVTPLPKEKSKVNYITRKYTKGQSSVTLDVGQSPLSVKSSDGENITLRVRKAEVGHLGELAKNLAPFTEMSVENEGDDVLIKASVTSGGFFRFSQNGSLFEVTAVAKHKNGKLGLSGKVIVIDPGHGSFEAKGPDYGAQGKAGVNEYQVVTPISMRLKDKLEAAGARVILTRGEAFKTISLSERAEVANNNNADAFISIHADSYVKDIKVHGSKIFYYDGNARLTTQVQSVQRKALATALANQIRGVSGRAQVNTANFAVNRENKVPSVLVETGFLTNPEEEARLDTPEYQEALAQAMFDGFVAYFSY